MLGYKARDVVDMQDAIKEAVFYLPPSNHDETRTNLLRAYDFLQGMLEEGRI